MILYKRVTSARASDSLVMYVDPPAPGCVQGFDTSIS